MNVRFDRPSFSASWSIIGNVATDVVVVNPTVYDPTVPRMNRAGPTPPRIRTSGSITKPFRMKRPTTTATMNTARFCSIAIPVCAITGAARPKTPTGAVHRIQVMSLMRASPSVSAKEVSVCCFSFGKVVVAAPRRTTKMRRGRSAPSAATSIGFLGTRLTRKSTTPGAWVSISAMAVGGGTGAVKLSAKLISPMPIRIAGSVVTQKNPSASPPSRPSSRRLAIRPTPTKTTAATSGMTTI